MTEVSEYKYIRISKEADSERYKIHNSKSGDSLGFIEFDKGWKKWVSCPRGDTKFDAMCHKDLNHFLTKLNEKKIFTDKKPGRPVGSKGYKHSFYVNKMKPCSNCNKFQDESCPYYYSHEGRENMQEYMFDEFGVARCVPEFKYFNELKKQFKSAYKITEAEAPLLDKMCMIMIRSGRVEEYLADEGLIQIRNVVDEKSGKVFEVPAQNLLKKDAYFDDKMIKEWLNNLKISRKERDVDSGSDDLAIVFTQEKRVEIKGNKEEIKKLVQKNQEKIQEHLNSSASSNLG